MRCVWRAPRCSNVKTNVIVSLVLKAVFSGAGDHWVSDALDGSAGADTGASVIVVANALRLLRAR
jgi:cation transport ATPase